LPIFLLALRLCNRSSRRLLLIIWIFTYPVYPRGPVEIPIPTPESEPGALRERISVSAGSWTNDALKAIV
jgi:hypothetical protein